MSMKEKGESWVTVAEVAEALGTTSLNVLMHLKRNLLEGQEVNGKWLVRADSLEMFVRKTSGQADRSLCRSSCPKAGGCGGCG